MPEILTIYGYHVYFWSNEGQPIEPIHIHISKNPHPNATKYWLLSDGTLQQENNNDHIPQNDLKRIIRFLSLQSSVNIIKKKWVSHFGVLHYIQ